MAKGWQPTPLARRLAKQASRPPRSGRGTSTKVKPWRPTPLARALVPQVQAGYQKPDEGGFDPLGELGEIASSLPGALVEIGKGVVSEGLLKPWEHLYEGVEGVVTGDRSLLDSVGDIASGIPLAGAAGRIGFEAGKGVITGEYNPDHPLSSGMGQSVRRTAGRVADPGQYADAAKEGHLLGTILEDVSNVALLAGGGGAAVNKVTGGAAKQALRAGQAVESAKKAVTSLEKQLGKLNAREASVRQAAEAYARRPGKVGADPIAGGRTAGDLAQLAAERVPLEEAIALANDAVRVQTANQVAALTQAGRLARPYRVLKGTQLLGDRGSLAIAAPWVEIGKVATKAFRAVLKADPKLEASLSRFVSSRGAAEIRNVQNAIATGLAESQGHGIRLIERELGGSDVLFQATMLDLTGVGKALVRARAQLRAVDPQYADQLIDDVAANPYLDVNPEALQLAIDLAEGNADAGVAQQIATAQEIYHAKIGRPNQAQYVSGYGAKRLLSPEALEARVANVEGRTVNPRAVEEAAQRRLLEVQELTEKVLELEGKAAGQKAGLIFDPADGRIGGQYVEALSHNADVAGSVASDLIDAAQDAAARGDGALLADLERLALRANEVGSVTPEVFAGKLAARLEGMVGKTEQLNQLPAEIGQAMRNADFVPVKAVPTGGARRTFARYERASGQVAVAKRLGAMAKRIRTRVAELRARGVPKQTTDRVAKRSREYAEAQANTARAADEASFAREQVAQGVDPRLPAELPDHMVGPSDFIYRRRQTAGQQTLDPAALEVEHRGAVLDAVHEAQSGVGSGVPPWVFDEFRWKRSVAREAGEAYPPEWDAILDGSRAATERFRHTPEGRILEAARQEVRAARSALAENLRAAQRMLDDEWAATGAQPLDLKQPFVPDGLFDDGWRVFGEQFAPMPRRGQPSNILDRLAEWRRGGGKRAGTRDTKEALAKKFAQLWKADYNRLPRWAREYLTIPDDATLRDIYRHYEAHGQFPDRLGPMAFDELADVYADAGQTVAGIDTHRMASHWAESVMLDQAVKRLENPKLRWSNVGSTAEGQMLELVGHAADELGIHPSAARLTIMGRPLNETAKVVMEDQIGVRRQPLSIPDDPAGVAQRLRESADPLFDEEIVAQAFGGFDNPSTSAFLDAWDQAGQPDLTATFDELARGERPGWLDGMDAPARERAVAAAEARAAAAGEIDATYEQFAGETPPGQLPGRQGLDPAERPILDETVARQQEKGARLNLERAVARGGTERAAGELSAVGSRLDQAAQNAAALADELDAGRSEAVASVAGPVAEQMAKEGAKIAAYRQTLRAIGITRRRLARMPERWAKEMDAILADFRNAPARARPALLVSQETGKILAALADDADLMAANPTLSLAVMDAQRGLLKNVKDIFEPGMLPDGTPLDPLFEPEFVPGGRIQGDFLPATGPNPPPVRLKKAGEQHAKLTSLMARSPAELESVLVRRSKIRVMNETARILESRFGVRANSVLGEDQVQAMRDANPDPAGFGYTLHATMKEAGYIAWDPAKLYQALDGGPGITEMSVFIPEHLYRKFASWYKPAGGFEMAFRRFYDRPTNVWKAMVLALSPRWHLNNIIGNALMAMSVGGLDPITYAKRIRQAHAVVKMDEVRWLEQHPELIERFGPLSGWRQARARRGIGARRARMERRIDTIEPEALEAMGGRDVLEVDPRIPQRGAGVSQIDPSGYAIKRERNRLQRMVDRSYELNGFFDDMNRLAVWLEESKRLKPRDAWNLAAKNGNFVAAHGVGGAGLSNLKNEAAVRLSLRAMGDFVSMSPVERQVVRRIFPFYAWLRHITQAAVKLPVYHPARTVWMLHIVEMFGEPAEFPLMKNTLPLEGFLGGGPNDYLKLPRFNPYEDVAPISPNIAETFGRSMNPIIKIGTAALTGVDTSTFQQYKRPPGAGPLDEYGREDSGPLLTDPEALLNIAASNSPQYRVLQQAKDSVVHGGPVLRFPTGEPQRSYGQPILAGSGPEAAILGYAGLPYRQELDVPSMRLLELRRKMARDKDVRRYFGPAGQ